MKPPRGIDPELWQKLVLLAEGAMVEREPAHDLGHVRRVVANVLAIAKAENVSERDEAIAAVAALLHEMFSLPKDHPDSAKAGDLCAVHARRGLEAVDAPRWLADGATGAIRDHAFSKGVVPKAVASRLVQDADRLDALGAIGLARMWATCADMKRPFYAPDDPFAESRAPDDKEWGLDHVKKKLLELEGRFHTDAARALAKPRIAHVEATLKQLATEIA